MSMVLISHAKCKTFLSLHYELFVLTCNSCVGKVRQFVKEISAIFVDCCIFWTLATAWQTNFTAEIYAYNFPKEHFVFKKNNF